MKWLCFSVFWKQTELKCESWTARVELNSVFITLWALAYISIWTNKRLVWHSAVLPRQGCFTSAYFFVLWEVSASLTDVENFIKQKLTWWFQGLFSLSLLWLIVQGVMCVVSCLCICFECKKIKDYFSVCTDFRSQTSWETGVASMMQNSEFHLCHSCFWCYIYRCCK